MLDFCKEIDFSTEIESNPGLDLHLQTAAKEIAEKYPPENFKKPFYDTQFNNLIIVCNLPKVPKEKLSILDKVLVEKLLGSCNLTTHVKNSLYGFLENPNTMTNGSAILEFITPESAQQACEKLHGVVLDKQHTLRVHTIAEFEKIMRVEEKFHPPKVLKKEELQKWLLDKALRDQYCFLSQKGDRCQIGVQWFDHLEKKPANALDKEGLEMKDVIAFDFSSTGSYLITIEKMGFQLWGGSAFEKLSWYQHLEVKNVEIAPNEKYILSFNGTINEAPDTENYIVWNLRTAEKLRSFKAERSEVWGSYQWSFDSQHLARLNEVSSEEFVLSVYKLPEVVMIQNEEGEKKSIKIPGLQRFSWVENSKTLCCISFKASVGGNVPTKVTLIEVPSRRDDRKWKTIIWEVTSCDIVSSLSGDWLALVMVKKNKNKHSTCLHLANMKKKTLEISDLDLPEKFKSYSVDRKSGRFAFIFQEADTKEGGGHIRYEIVFVGIDTQDMVFKDFGRLSKRTSNEVLFGSNGSFFVLLNKDPHSATQGALEFGYFKSIGVGILCLPEITKTSNMPYMTMACYDPTGRFLITGSKDTKTYILWNAYGEQIYKDTVNASNLLQVMWRKRPRVEIDKKKEEDITTNFKVYKQKFEEHDDKIINKIKYELEEKRKLMKIEFMGYLESRRKEWEDSKPKRKDMLGFDDDDFSDISLEEIIENTLVLEEKPVGKN